MPELPEVEVVATHLNILVAGRRIISAELIRQRLAPESNPREFSEKLDGGRINFVHRRGKFILFDLDNGQTLAVHLRMSGRFALLGEGTAEPKFTHAAFDLDDTSRLVFTDQRHFGYMGIFRTERIAEFKGVAKLAPEPFSADFSAEFLAGRLSDSKRSVKELLLDQTRVCGLGNIYASEALFLARIAPTLRGNDLSDKLLLDLHAAIRSVLGDAIELGRGVPIEPENIGGNFYGENSEDFWQVYDREGEPCPVCRSEIKRIVQGGRSTYFCPSCQQNGQKV